jgi:signal transduction histidine kinase
MSHPQTDPMAAEPNGGNDPILVADDDREGSRVLADRLAAAGHPVVVLHSGKEILEWLAHRRARLLLLEVRLPDMDGTDVLEALARSGHAPPFLIISATADTRVAVDYMRRGARDYLIKDARFPNLVPTVVERVLDDLERDDQLDRLQREIIEISERDQRRIGQDIHDDLCQRLAAIKMKLQHLANEVRRAAPALADDAATLSHHLGEATRVARTLARGLSPVDIGHDGLPAALLGLARTAEEIFRIECPLHVEGTCRPLGHHAATQLFRITQECIANAVKHAAATKVAIHLRCADEPIVLTVTNDGRPFPMPPAPTGLGLHLMRHRAESTKASLEFIHQPAAGTTTVRITLPHHEKEH